MPLVNAYADLSWVSLRALRHEREAEIGSEGLCNDANQGSCLSQKIATFVRESERG
jgi:hypothetical protein